MHKKSNSVLNIKVNQVRIYDDIATVFLTEIETAHFVIGTKLLLCVDGIISGQYVVTETNHFAPGNTTKEYGRYLNIENMSMMANYFFKRLKYSNVSCANVCLITLKKVMY